MEPKGKVFASKCEPRLYVKPLELAHTWPLKISQILKVFFLPAFLVAISLSWAMTKVK